MENNKEKIIINNKYTELESDEYLGRIWSNKIQNLPDTNPSSFDIKNKLIQRWNQFFDDEIENISKSKRKRMKKNESTSDINETNENNKTEDNFNNDNEVEEYEESIEEDKETIKMTKFQLPLYALMEKSQDILYSNRTYKNEKEIMSLYLLHALNLVFKTRDLVLKHNNKLLEASMKKKELIALRKKYRKNKEKLSQLENPEKYDLEFRDKGYTRPKVLILLPMRNTCFKLIELMFKLIPKSYANNISNKSKFIEEFYSDSEGSNVPKPEEWLHIFAGNTDDTFRLGVSFAQKYMILYSDFYASDIIIASPLGLRLCIEDQQEGNYDFLSSIELVIVDQADIMVMQNWDHVEFIFERLSKIPTKPRDTDFSRIKQYYLDGNAKYYRQNIILGAFVTSEINHVFNRKCHNIEGKMKIREHAIGTINLIEKKIRKVFHRIDCNSIQELDDTRLEYFINNIYFVLKNTLSEGTLIYIPSYFDYVRVKKYFEKMEKEDDIDFVSCCEYTKHKYIVRYRKYFTSGRAKYFIMSERLHFYNRFYLKGVKNIVFYSPPLYPHYYQEICNWMEPDGTCMMLYTKYDGLQMEAILGSKQCEILMTMEDSTHTIV